MKEPIIKASQLCKQFPASEDSTISVLDRVDCVLNRGESISIRGDSGSGKSTFLNVLSGLERADSGRLIWNGEDVTNFSVSKLARARANFIGFVFQAYYLVPELNALENVLLAARIAGRFDSCVSRRAEALLNRVGLKDRMGHSSNKLSGGERQRVAVARALINDPPIVLADEPTGNLDESTGLAVIDLLLEMTDESDKTLVLVTHNPHFSARTERQWTLHLGQLSQPS